MWIIIFEKLQGIRYLREMNGDMTSILITFECEFDSKEMMKVGAEVYEVIYIYANIEWMFSRKYGAQRKCPGHNIIFTHSSLL